MMIKPELAKKLIEQVRNEFAASLQYLAIAIYFEQESMDNTAAFFYAQAAEENEHGMKLLRYVVETGGNAELLAIPAPVAKNQISRRCFPDFFKLGIGSNRSDQCTHGYGKTAERLPGRKLPAMVCQ